MALALGATAALYTTTGNGKQNESNGITPTSSSDNIIVVVWSMCQGDTSNDISTDITSITYGTASRSFGTGAAMTVAVTEDVGGKRSTTVIAWIKAQGGTGQTVQTNTVASMRATALDVFEITGVDQTTPVPEVNSFTTIVAGPTAIGLTTDNDGNWLVGACSIKGNGGTSGVSDGTLIKTGGTGTVSTSDVQFASGYKNIATAGAATMSFTHGATNDNTFCVLEVKVASTGEQTDKSINFSIVTGMALTKFAIRPKAVNFGMVTGITRSLITSKPLSVGLTTAMSTVKETRKPFALGFATAMALAKFSIRPKAINFATITGISRSLITSKPLSVALITTPALVKKTVPIAKTVSFSTSMVTTTTKLAFKAIAFTMTSVMALSTAFTAGGEQVARPDADTATGSWVTAPLWSKVDDDATGAGDGIEITSDAVANNIDTTFCDLKLSDVPDPAVSTGHIIRVRWRHDQGAARILAGHCELWEGVPGVGTKRASVDVPSDVTLIENLATYTLNAGEADSITDYTDLYLRLWGRGTSGGTSRSLIVEACEFGVPSADFALTEKAINIAMVTAMATTPTPHFGKAVAVGFATAMALSKQTRKTFTVSFPMSVALAKETRVTKAVNFVTGMALATAIVTAKALSVAFVNAMALAKRLELSKAISVTFSTTMALAKTTQKTFTTGFSTAFALAKTTKPIKAVSFVTSMALTKAVTLAQAFSFSAITTMALSTARQATKAISVAFVTAMSTVTDFTAGSGVFGRIIWLIRRRRR